MVLEAVGWAGQGAQGPGGHGAESLLGISKKSL